MDEDFDVPETQRQIDTHRDTCMDIGHRTAPPGVEKFRKIGKLDSWTAGRLDGGFKILETDRHAQTQIWTEDIGQRPLVLKSA